MSQHLDAIKPAGRRLCECCGVADISARTKGARYCLQCRNSGRARWAMRRSHSVVAIAVKCHRLAPPTQFACVDCGGPANQYDHRDYSRPLDVVPVCRDCNFKRGAGKFRHALPIDVPEEQAA